MFPIYNQIIMDNKLRKNSQAFTLIEILVAITIVAILASVVLVSMKSYAVKARSAKALGQASSTIPSMVSCWGNGGSVRSSGSGDICDIGPGYGAWPDLSTIGYSYNSIPSAKSSSWFFTVAGDSLTICCNSTMNSCGVLDSGSCDAAKTW